MEIIRVNLDDLEAIMKIERTVFESDSFSKQIMVKLILSNSLFLKLVENQITSKIVGYIIAIHDDRHIVNIINLSIKKEYQHKGYGSYLLQLTLELIKKNQDIHKVILNVKTTNKIAIGLYQKFKFQIVQEIENYYSNHESAYLMELIL